MSNVTIPKSKGDDPNYRYKRPRVGCVYVRKGGGQTQITNVKELCHSIEVEPVVLCKILQKALSTKIRVKDFSFSGTSFTPEQLDDI